MHPSLTLYYWSTTNANFHISINHEDYKEMVKRKMPIEDYVYRKAAEIRKNWIALGNTEGNRDRYKRRLESIFKVQNINNQLVRTKIYPNG